MSNKNLFQALSLPFRERDRAMPVPLRHRGKNRADEGRLTEKRQDKRYRDALWASVRNSNGRISPVLCSRVFIKRACSAALTLYLGGMDISIVGQGKNL